LHVAQQNLEFVTTTFRQVYHAQSVVQIEKPNKGFQLPDAIAPASPLMVELFKDCNLAKNSAAVNGLDPSLEHLAFRTRFGSSVGIAMSSRRLEAPC
jgi:hypothetical protein